MDYIIVQAGGKGSRLKNLTVNKPKALVPIENLPMIFHLFSKYPKKRFIIITDYKKEVFRRYLACFAGVKYLLVETQEKGTCAGISQALAYVPEQEPLWLVWSDLILGKELQLPEDGGNYIGLSKEFPCRWKYQDGIFEESPSTEYGVAGVFGFSEKKCLAGLSREGEFVGWLKEQQMKFEELPLYGTREYGLLEKIPQLEGGRCRPFNQMTIEGEFLIKRGITEQGVKLGEDEKAWYAHMQGLGYEGIPKISSFAPLTMERIHGKNIFQYQCTEEEKKNILEKIVGMLKELHKMEVRRGDPFSSQEAYYGKTVKRLQQVRELLPFSNEPILKINGRTCRNVFFHLEELEQAVRPLLKAPFCLIHGDCTFSNLMLREDKEPVMIDPRGYFGYSKFYGDPLYDWAKLYYSLVGNYDQFNLKQFSLEIKEDHPEVNIKIKSNGWEKLEQVFFNLLSGEVEPAQLKLVHAIIWLSLTTYAWEDYDSICGAFYQGLYYLEEVL